jgi:hypothetical protein
MSLGYSPGGKKFIAVVIILVAVFFFTAPEARALNTDKIRILTHSTGRNLYNAGVAGWFTDFNTSHGTTYEISRVDYPSDSLYGHANYPYDWWNIWGSEDEQGNPRQRACQSGEPDLECLEGLASQYDVIVFKQCYPGADVREEAASGPSISSARKTVENYKLQYRALRSELDKFPDTLFIVWTLVPRRESATNLDNSGRARTFVNWVRDDWLTEDGNPHPNIRIFDYWGHASDSDNYLKDTYERDGTDSHPNTLANEEIYPLFSQCIIDNINTFTQVPDSEAPTAPTGLTAEAVSESKIKLSWTASTDNRGISRYRIFQNNQEVTTTWQLSHTVDNGLNPSTTYSFSVRAEDFSGNPSGHSNTASATTMAAGSVPVEKEVISVADNWAYFKGTQEPPAQWKETGFDDSQWLQGATGIGYGDDDDNTELLDMSGNYSSVYLRKTFLLDMNNISAMFLDINYDDGFIAYLNGTEVASSNVNSGAAHDSFATQGREADQVESIDLTSHISLLVSGQNNVLAIQGHNGAISSSDFSIIPSLRITGFTNLKTLNAPGITGITYK